MNVCRCALSAILALAAALPVAGQTPAQPAPAQQPAQPPASNPQDPEAPPKYEEIVVVSGSRTEQKLIDAAPTMSVISGPTIELAPSQSFADLLRSVPGLNV